MAFPDPDRPVTLVAGGASRLATALRAHLPADTRYIVRRATGAVGEIVIADYAEIPDGAFAGVGCVVNCVGTSEGPPALLDRLNVATPLAIATAARAAGVGGMIHVSSFSVYGGAERIDGATPADARSDYGRSKLAGDDALMALATPAFRVTALRLPLIYAPDGPSKLRQLLRLWSRVRVLPVPRGDVTRAMIGVEVAAEVVARLLAEPSHGIVLAADPAPFTYREAAAARGGTLKTFTLPGAVVGLAQRLAPALSDRLFRDSALADSANAAIRFGLASRLYRDIAGFRR